MTPKNEGFGFPWLSLSSEVYLPLLSLLSFFWRSLTLLSLSPWLSATPRPGKPPGRFLEAFNLKLGNTFYTEHILELFGQTHYHWIPTNVAKLIMKISSHLELEIGFDYWGLLPFNRNIQPHSNFQSREIWIFMPPSVTHVGLFKASQITNKGFQVIISLKSTHIIIVPSTEALNKLSY